MKQLGGTSQTKVQRKAVYGNGYGFLTKPPHITDKIGALPDTFREPIRTVENA